MDDKIYNARIKHKRDTSANWTSSDPVLLDGEIIIVDTDNGVRTKTGDGEKKYTQLPFDDETVRNLISAKLSISQGSNNSGKILSIGTDGNITMRSVIGSSGISASISADGNSITIVHDPSGVVSGGYGDTEDKVPGFGDTFNVPSFGVDSAGHITFAEEHTIKIPSAPTAIKNPHAITFTGAVNGSYDGSNPVNIEIPDKGVITTINGICDDGVNVTFSNIPTNKVAFDIIRETLQVQKIPELAIANSAGDWETRLRLARNGDHNYIFTNYEVTDDGNGISRLQMLKISDGEENGEYQHLELGGWLLTSGGTMSGDLTLNGKLILNEASYGTSLPASGVAGQVFFKKM